MSRKLIVVKAITILQDQSVYLVDRFDTFLHSSEPAECISVYSSPIFAIFRTTEQK
jgi:hypothetical protein